MFQNCRLWLVGIASVLILSAAGCPQKKADEKRSPQPDFSSLPDGDKGQSPSAKPEEPPPPATIPKVSMSDEIRAGCLVHVGDAMPEAELADFSNEKHSLKSEYGEKLTVLCFWTIGTTRRAQLVAAAALQDLAKEIAEPFEADGVQALAVNVGDAAADAKKYVDDANATFPCFVDPNGDFFARVTKDRKMPRVYLLDTDGKILWFDVEYSRSSREDLVQGILVALGKLK